MTADTVIMAGYPVGPNAARILAFHGLARSFADICRDTGQEPLTVNHVLAVAKHLRGRAAQMALAWQHKTGNSLLNMLQVQTVAPPPAASNAELRAWAEGRGMPCSPRGRVPAYIRIAHERFMAQDLRES